MIKCLECGKDIIIKEIMYMESIIKNMCQSLDNDKLFNSCLAMVVGSNGRQFSEEELDEIDEKYNIDLNELIENNEEEFFEYLFKYIDKSKLYSIEAWLDDWSDFDDIALCKIGDKKYEYDEAYDNYMHHIIPGVLNLFYL